MPKTVKELEQGVADARKALEVGKIREQSLKEMGPAIPMAEELHDWLCHSNHTDGCGWCYESWEKPGHARRGYVEMAQRVIKAGFDVGDIRAINKAIKGK